VEDTRYSQVPLIYSIVANLQQAKGMNNFFFQYLLGIDSFLFSLLERNVSASIDRSIEGFRTPEAALANQEVNVENKYISSEQIVVGKVSACVYKFDI
jgi:hypothetical protein